VVLGAVLAVLTVWFCALQPRDPDTYWHIRTGQLILDTGSIPRTDPYSYVLNGSRWVTFEWLSEVVFYLCTRAFPAAGMEILRAVLSVAAALGFFALGGAGPWAFFSLSLILLARHGFLQERPQLFDYVLLPLFFGLCRRDKEPGRVHWSLLPLAACLWANLHGGAAFVGGGIVLLRAAIAYKLPGEGGRAAAQRWALLGAACLAAVFVNPHGLALIGHTGGTVLFRGREVIGEWQAFHDPASWEGLFLAAGAAAVAYGWREEPLLAAGAAVFGLMTLSAIRHAFLYELTLSALLGRELQRRRPAWTDWKGPAAALAAILCLCGFFSWRFAEYRPVKVGTIVKLPDQAVKFLDDNDVRGRMFHSYELGGYLIAKCWPRRKVFVDGRNLEYGPEFISQVIHWYTVPGFEALDARWGFDYALLTNGQWYKAQPLDLDKRWALVFWDDAGLVYLKREPRNETLIAKYGYELLQPNRPDFAYLLPLLADKKRAAKVLAELDRGIASSPESVNGREMRAFALDALGRGGDALSQLKETAALFPDKPGPQMSLGWWYERHGRLPEARDAYAAGRWAARRQQDELSEAYLDNNLAMVEARLGNKDEAVRLLRRCLDLMPTHPRAAANLARLERE
jgi:tetratricopeptide (TPR) repeat protein